MAAIYWFSFFKMFLVLIPVFVPYLESIGLTMSQVMMTQSAFAIVVALSELPTGYFADRFGRKRSLIVGSLIYTISFFYLVVARTYEGILIYEVAIGVGMGFINGADVALIYGHLTHSESQKKSLNQGLTKAFANLQLAQVCGESSAAVIAGYLMTYGFDVVLKTQAVVGLFPLFCALIIPLESTPKFSATQEKLNFNIRLKEFFRAVYAVVKVGTESQVFLVALVINGLASFVSVWLLQKYWIELHVSGAMFGYLWAGLNLSAGVVGKFAYKIFHTLPRWCTFFLIGGLPSLSFIVMAEAGYTVGLIAALGFYVSRGLTQTILKQAYNRHVSDEFRATANSVPSFLFRLTFAVLGPAIGAAVDHLGLRQTFLYLAIGIGIATTLSLRPLMSRSILD
jgi:MFS family permease